MKIEHEEKAVNCFAALIIVSVPVFIWFINQ